MAVLRKVETNLKNAALLLFPRFGRVAQLRKTHSMNCNLLLLLIRVIIVARLIFVLFFGPMSKNFSKLRRQTNERSMTPKMSGIAQPFKNTPIIETDATLNKDVERNTKEFCKIDLKQKSIPLADT